MEAARSGYATNTPSNSLLWEGYADDTAYLLDGRVVIYTVFTPDAAHPRGAGDSRHASSRDVESDEVAARAALTLAKTSGTVIRGRPALRRGRLPARRAGPIFLTSASLRTSESTVAASSVAFLIAAGARPR